MTNLYSKIIKVKLKTTIQNLKFTVQKLWLFSHEGFLFLSAINYKHLIFSSINRTSIKVTKFIKHEGSCMKRIKQESYIHRMWKRIHDWRWKKRQLDVLEQFLIQREERKDYRKNLRQPFPKGPKSPRVYKFYWSGYWIE